MIFPKTLAPISFISFGVATVTQPIKDKLRNIFLSILPSIWDLYLWLENVSKTLKNLQLKANFFQILHDGNYDNFSILLNKSNVFKLHLKESLLIKKDRPELNRNDGSYPLGHFWLIIALLYFIVTLSTINC